MFNIYQQKYLEEKKLESTLKSQEELTIIKKVKKRVDKNYEKYQEKVKKFVINVS